jgi:hypothetical protein
VITGFSYNTKIFHGNFLQSKIKYGDLRKGKMLDLTKIRLKDDKHTSPVFYHKAKTLCGAFLLIHSN